MTVEDGGHVADHTHTEYLTEDDLRGWLARWLISAAIVVASALVASLIWGATVSARLDAQANRIEEIRREGSQPVQTLQRDLDRVGLKIDNLTQELVETRGLLTELQGRGRSR